MIQKLSIAPYIRTWRRTWLIMMIVAFTLLPHVILAYFNHGSMVVQHIGLMIAGTIGWELMMNALYRRWTLLDGSAILTGLILALITPLNLDLMIMIQITFFAIIIAKWMFGGLGFNYMNPAMFALLIGLLSWPLQIDLLQDNSVTIWSGLTLASDMYQLDELAGYQLWSLGFYSSMIMIGAFVILVSTGMISWETTLSYLVSYGLFSYLFLGLTHWYESLFMMLTPMNLLIGVYLINNPSSLPSTFTGRIIKSMIVALLLGIFQQKSGYLIVLIPIAILLGDLLVPMIDRYTQGRTFSKVRVGGK
ncbi:RnfABCDGE type electron transport complex subunit D [Entomospira entomophila]|uniref:RnfABCDGE type electron transport complex subunit D n=1 Tax=Entomospira entomophila TaxID=2719988 RepID=A0A968G9Q6_9SPIO|nr:RnfABCDGE type electron transport complex subunit D [Entomospira entomophilus]NIZ41180.1 RnfABCDGE type electron transport complex subunit D [Entomospira entomophilus]WDI35387.1 RnfABCDGE type electron transport complex subunit D [Entomospira entomophilus]